MKKYYVEVTNENYGYILQSRWFKTRRAAIEWAKGISYLFCEIESHKSTLKTKEEILAFMKENWDEKAVTKYISHDGKQCYRVFGNTIHFQDLCERANIEWKWDDDKMIAKGSDFELEYCEYDIILAFEK